MKTGSGRWLTAALIAAGAITVFFPFFWMAVTSPAPEKNRFERLDLESRFTSIKCFIRSC